ncbi:TIR domain-containing protein [Aequorivita antarctica]|nr:nucleotide-binding protein [Aequorivita antarctica]SRX76517.1 hypothetical protein AEQU3_03517 [Aequorivita antarctica]
MATRKKQVVSPITKLKKQKAVFEKELEDRIAIGESIIEDRIENDEDFGNAKSQYSEWTDYNLELLKQSFNNPANEYWRSYDNCTQTVGFTMSVIGGARPKPNQDLVNFLRRVELKLGNLTKLKNKINLLNSDVEDEVLLSDNTPIEINMSQVFIVHGHDDLTKITVESFIKDLGFEPIILHKQASSGKTIIEKIEAYSNVGFGIVLYTPCDVGSKQMEKLDLKPRARQNVVFEHGYLIGKIGRENVCAIVKDNVETPNDITGVVYIALNGEWKIDLAKELRNSGYKVDMNKVV